MNKILKILFTSAEESLDLQVLKQVDDFVIVSNENMEMVYRQFKNFLKKDHAQIRFSCMLFADHMFYLEPCFSAMLDIFWI
jgi:ribosomal protein L10